MAKRKESESQAQPRQSILEAAWNAFEAGDMVEARRLATAVVNGQAGRDDEAVAVALAKAMTGTVAVGESPVDVAKALVERTQVVRKSYMWAAVSLSVFALLVTLALTRYSHS